MDIEFSFELFCPTAKAWAVLSDFSDLSWYDDSVYQVEVMGQGVGMTRALHWCHVEQPSIHRLEHRDNDRMQLSYSVHKSHVTLLDNAVISLSLMPATSKTCLLKIQYHNDSVVEAYEADVAIVLEAWAEKSVKALNLRLMGAEHVLQPSDSMPKR